MVHFTMLAPHSDTVALLGYDPKKQVGVVDKTNSFIGRITHRVVSDMVRIQRSSELEDMCFVPHMSEQQRAKCHEVRRCHVLLILLIIICFWFTCAYNIIQL